MTRHLATLRCYRRGALSREGRRTPALVPPNGITRGPAVNRGLDCTLSRLGKSCPFEPSRPTPYQSLRGGGVCFVLKRSADNCYPPSPADWARVWVDYHWSRPLTGFSDGLLAVRPTDGTRPFSSRFPQPGRLAVGGPSGALARRH